MKRFNKTAVALATAGAMTLAVVPNASAQGRGWWPEDQPELIGGADVTANPDGSGANVSTESNSTDAKPEEVFGQRTDADGTEAKPEDIFGQQGGGTVAGDYETNATELRSPEENAGVNREELKPEDVFKEDGTTVDKDKLKKVLIGLGATAGVLTIAGIVYKIVKNSKGEPVLVPADRADQTPTAADEAKTEELLENNAAEIAAQAGAADATTGDAATADRGVGAATGNNTIAKGLVGLLIASIMGAAAFAFGRRRLV